MFWQLSCLFSILNLLPCVWWMKTKALCFCQNVGRCPVKLGRDSSRQPATLYDLDNDGWRWRRKQASTLHQQLKCPTENRSTTRPLCTTSRNRLNVDYLVSDTVCQRFLSSGRKASLPRALRCALRCAVLLAAQRGLTGTRRHSPHITRRSAVHVETTH